MFATMIITTQIIQLEQPVCTTNFEIGNSKFEAPEILKASFGRHFLFPTLNLGTEKRQLNPLKTKIT